MKWLVTPLRSTPASPPDGQQRARSDQAVVAEAKLQVKTWFSAR